MPGEKGKVLNFIRDNNLISHGDKVIVATSGGVDSITLLEFLRSNATQLGITVEAAHVNHGMRGETADRDMRFVEDYCSRWSIPFHLYNAKTSGITIPAEASEDWARQLRYNFFDQLAIEHNAKIATAHSMSDQAETVLFRMARGSGLRGMCGIPVQRDSYIRPFLCLTRTNIVNLSVYFGLDHVEDESNASDDYSRNIIRHRVLPELKGIHPMAVENINEMVSQLAQVNSYITKQVEKMTYECEVIPDKKYSVKNLASQDELLINQFIYTLISKHTEPSKRLIALIGEAVSAAIKQINEPEMLFNQVDLTDTKTITVTNHYITVKTGEAEVDLSVPGVVSFGELGYNYVVEQYNISDYTKAIKSKSDLAHFISARNYSKLRDGGLRLDSWKPGDKFKPACKVSRKVKNVMKELKIPLADRDQIPLLRNSDDEIVWIWGMGFTDGMLGDGQDSKVMVRFRELKPKGL